MYQKAIFSLKATTPTLFRRIDGTENMYHVFSVKRTSTDVDQNMTIEYSVFTIKEDGNVLQTIAQEKAIVPMDNESITSKKAIDASTEILSKLFTKYATTKKIYGFEEFVVFDTTVVVEPSPMPNNPMMTPTT